MKKLLLSISLFFIFSFTYAQKEKKVLYGSFVFENQVYQYMYKRESGIHSFNLSNLQRQNPLANIDTLKLNKTVRVMTESFQKDKIKSDDSATNAALTDGLKDTLAAIPAILEQFQNVRSKLPVWEKHSAEIDKFINSISSISINKLNIPDSVKKEIYDVNELLTAYKYFLENFSKAEKTDDVFFPELEQEEFRLIFEDQINKLTKSKNKGSKDETISNYKKKVVSLADKIMFEIKARIDFSNDQPITAYMILKKKYIDLDFSFTVKRKGVDTTFNKKIPVEVQAVIVEFEDGGIKNIFADLLPIDADYRKIYGSNAIRFRNIKPVSIIGKFDPDDFSKHKIQAGNQTELMVWFYNKMKAEFQDSALKQNEFFFLHKPKNPRAYVNSKVPRLWFALSEILDYKIISETDNEDYSPSNSKIELSESHPNEELKKERRSNILSARAYSDFMGLGDDQPNGLVQIEVSKRINLVAGRAQGIFKIFGAENQKGIYSGGLAFIEPRFTVSKIEENNRYLSVDSFQLDRSKSFADSTAYFNLNPLDVLRFQQWSFGADFNMFKFNLHNRKSNFQVNGTLNFGRTTISDSLRISQSKIFNQQSNNLSRISTTTYGIGIQYEVKPDSRFGFSLGYDIRWVDVLNPRFEWNDQFNNRIQSAWFNGFLKMNEDSKLFWRFRKNWIYQNNKYNFYQIQLGYELDLFKVNK